MNEFTCFIYVFNMICSLNLIVLLSVCVGVPMYVILSIILIENNDVRSVHSYFYVIALFLVNGLYRP